jgi:octaprenyl-diphosphate synthase
MNAVLSRETTEQSERVELLGQLESLCTDRGLTGLALRMGELLDFVGTDLASFEAELTGLPRHPHLVGRGATHLVDLGGKRLRPICVALASRLGTGFDIRVLDLAVAVELVHSATLLHDDVVDLSDTRRGAPTTRAIFGNAASIFAGDWLLIEALRRVWRSGAPGDLEELFATIEEMIFAESLQLENRGRVHTGRDLYFRVVEGKTAALFRWAMKAGGRAGGLGEEECQALTQYGTHLGVAFQATDDLLDLTGDVERTGKELFTDLREGKMTYPLIVALEREAALLPLVEQILATPLDVAVPDEVSQQVIEILRSTDAVEDCLSFARERSALAVAALEGLPQGRANRALATVAEVIVDRDL